MSAHRGKPAVTLPPGATLITGGKDRPPKGVRRVVVRASGTVKFYEGYARTTTDCNALRRLRDPNRIIGFYLEIGYEVTSQSKRIIVLEKRAS